MDRAEFQTLLAGERPLLLDGAMGTVLYGLGVSTERPLDLLNLENPKLVADVHRAYIDAGADIILTNSFGANRYKLEKHGLADKVSPINSAAVTIARRVIDSSFKPVLLAGSVGPLAVTLAPLGRVSPREAGEAFAAQMRALIQPEQGVGVDLLLIETLSSLSEMRTAIEVARDLAPQLPLVAQMTFTRDDRTLMGHTAEEIALQLQRLDVDVLGVNCSSGPAQLLRLLHKMHAIAPDLPLSASPNAGWPEDLEGGRVLYPAMPPYFARFVHPFQATGVRLMGGCCGTTAEHIAAMRQALDAPPPAEEAPLPIIVPHPAEEIGSASPDQPTQLALALQHGEFVTAVELIPPKGIAIQKLVATARSLHESGISFFSVNDVPGARMRMGASAAAHQIQQTVHAETLLHFPTRGRSLLRIQADLLAAHALGLRNLFVTLGDPSKVGDYPDAVDTYDIMPSGLIQLIKQQLNAGVDQLDNALDQSTNFFVGCTLNLTPHNRARELRLFKENIANGADFALSKPVFDVAAALSFLEAIRAECDPVIPILATVQPLHNLSMAEYLHNEVPGIEVPEEFLQQMRLSTEPQWVGVNIAQEIAIALQPHVSGVVIVPFNGRYDLAAEVLDVLT